MILQYPTATLSSSFTSTGNVTGFAKPSLNLLNYRTPPSSQQFSSGNALKFDQPSAILDSGLKFREKICYLQSIGVNPTKALQKNPNVRSARLSTLQSMEHCLTSMGINRSAVGRVLDMYPQLLTADPYGDVYPVFDFLLNDVKIPYHDVEKSIVRCPRLLVCSVEEKLKPAFEYLRELGFVGTNRITCRNTVLLVSNVDNTLVPKIDYLISLGFQYKDVTKMVLRSPGLLTFSIENNYKPKTEYFLEQMNGQLEELRRFPHYFSFSLERKIKPRHQKLMKHRFSMSLSEMLRVSDGEFNVRLIEMQLQLGKGRL